MGVAVITLTNLTKFVNKSTLSSMVGIDLTTHTSAGTDDTTYFKSIVDALSIVRKLVPNLIHKFSSRDQFYDYTFRLKNFSDKF
jgi:hypothetical protein